MSVLAFVVTACLPDTAVKDKVEQPQEDVTGFKHGSPRPECLQETDVDRVAYFEAPQVVTGGWSEPVKVAGPLTDACPNDAVEISADGKTIYFYWSPKVGGSTEELLHIYTGTYWAERTGSDPGVFSVPRFFDLQKGTKGGSIDAVVNITPGGDYVYFHSTRSENLGFQATPPTDDYLDIYVAPLVGGEPQQASNLGEPVNSVYLDGEFGLSPDGTRLYLTSNRPGGLGANDLWMSKKQGDAWGEPVNLGAPINSASSELQPAFAAGDPDTMYFVSDRDGPSSIYRSHFDGSKWSEPERLITGYVGEPAPVGDGSILYFVHVLVDDQGVFGSNIWYLRRE